MRHAHEPLRGLIGDPPVLADHAELLEPVPAPDVEVVGVMTGGDLQRPGAELRLDVVVGDDLQPAPDDRQDRLLADQPAVAVIVGMDGDRGVGEHRLGADRGDRHCARSRRQGVVDVVEGVGDLAILDLEVGDRRARARIPVDQVPVAVDVALLVEGDEHPQHGIGVRRIEGEALVGVVA